MINSNIVFPAQKKSYNQKNESWRKECVDGAEQACIWKNEGLRKSFYTKRINYNLYSDILDQRDIENIVNPFGIMGLKAPAKMQNYPICNPKIDLLVGESINRRFDYKVKIVNDDAISEKEIDLKKRLQEMIIAHLQGEGITDQQLQEDLVHFQYFQDFEYQDSKERLATQILEYLYYHLKLDYVFSIGFKDALICAEEMYLCDIIGGEPRVSRLNPLNVHTVRSGESPWVEDSDIITIVDYPSPGQIIDEYHDDLSPDQVDSIEKGMNTQSKSSGRGIDIGRFSDLPLDPSNAIDITMLSEDFSYGGKFDNNGNIRRTRVYWKSMRKLLKVKYYDEQGDEQYELYDENYKIDKSKGEESEVLWVSEWWEGHKIGGSIGSVTDNDSIYVRMRVKPVQFRSMENPSKCHPGIIGKIYSTNDNQAVSLMDRMKPYQYLYNILGYNTELAISKNKGKIMRLGLHEIPEGWKIDKWLSYAEGMNIAVYDAFKESNKGSSQGKIAGAMNQNSPVIDMEMGNTIQLYMNMMAFIKQELGEISGVSQARQGQISSRQAVGNTEVEVNQSSMITEYWFQEHDMVKIRVLECLLEVAKYAWKDKKNKKVQYILDDGANAIFSVDGEQFNECEYGLCITNDRSAQELYKTVKGLAQVGFQNQMINFSQLLDIYSTSSIASIRRKIIRSENEKIQREQAQAKREEESANAQIVAAKQAQESEQAFEREEWDREDIRNEKILENKLEIERMRQDNNESRYSDNLNDSGEDIFTLEQLRQQNEKILKDHQIKVRDQQEKERHNKKTEEQKDRDLSIKSKQKNTPTKK